MPQGNLNANKFFLDRGCNIYHPDSIADYYYLFSQPLTNKQFPEKHNHKSFPSASNLIHQSLFLTLLQTEME